MTISPSDESLGTTPSSPATAWSPKPYVLFLRKSRGRVLSIDESPVAQAQARALVAAGLIAYRNRGGYIRNVAQPGKQQHAGSIFGFEQD